MNSRIPHAFGQFGEIRGIGKRGSQKRKRYVNNLDDAMYKPAPNFGRQWNPTSLEADANEGKKDGQMALQGHSQEIREFRYEIENFNAKTINEKLSIMVRIQICLRDRLSEAVAEIESNGMADWLFNIPWTETNLTIISSALVCLRQYSSCASSTCPDSKYNEFLSKSIQHFFSKYPNDRDMQSKAVNLIISIIKRNPNLSCIETSIPILISFFSSRDRCSMEGVSSILCAIVDSSSLGPDQIHSMFSIFRYIDQYDGNLSDNLCILASSILQKNAGADEASFFEAFPVQSMLEIISKKSIKEPILTLISSVIRFASDEVREQLFDSFNWTQLSALMPEMVDTDFLAAIHFLSLTICFPSQIARISKAEIFKTMIETFSYSRFSVIEAAFSVLSKVFLISESSICTEMLASGFLLAVNRYADGASSECKDIVAQIIDRVVDLHSISHGDGVIDEGLLQEISQKIM